MNILSLSWSQSYEIGIEIILLKINKDKNTNAGPRLKCFFLIWYIHMYIKD